MKIRLKESDSERPQKCDRDGMPDQVYQGLHHTGEVVEEAEHHQDEESGKKDNVQGPEREPEPPPTISSGEGPHETDRDILMSKMDILLEGVFK